MSDREALLNQIEKLAAQVRLYSERVSQLEKLNTVYRNALELIAVPKRADGTYNRGREACESLARSALYRQDYKSVAGQGDAQSRADQGDEPGTTGPAASRTAQATCADCWANVTGHCPKCGASATQVCKHIPFIGAKGEPHCQLCGINLLSSNEDKQADHTGKPGCRCRECHAQRASSNECHAKRKSSNEGESK